MNKSFYLGLSILDSIVSFGIITSRKSMATKFNYVIRNDSKDDIQKRFDTPNYEVKRPLTIKKTLVNGRLIKWRN